MKIFVYIVIGIGVLVLGALALYVFGSTGPIASARSERILRDNSSVLNYIDMGIDIARCKYIGPSRLMGTHNPGFECGTGKTYNDVTAKKVAVDVAALLQKAGWQGSAENFKYDPRKVQFFKGDLSLYIEPYEWYVGATQDAYPFLIIFSRTTLWKPTWAM